MSKRKFDKPVLSLEGQLHFLIQQGLVIDDINSAKRVLETVGYYRFSGYLLPFKQSHQKDFQRRFSQGITFNHVFRLYQFDSELRLLVSEAIEKIEVAFRASISNVTSKEYGAFWYVDSHFFRDKRQHETFCRKIYETLKNPEELFIKHYLENYDDPKHPPIWMMVETLSFGACSKLFSNIQSLSVRKKISQVFCYHVTVIESWMKVIVWVRNICAHQARLWNRWLVEAPIIPREEALHSDLVEHNRKFIACAYIITKLLDRISEKGRWKKNLYDLFTEYEEFPGITMGFQKDWKRDPFWDDLSVS